VLNINKPSPWTSHDAVQRVRRILGQRKVGHTGTLDPYATGVLLCCVGRATKLSSVLMDLPKRYAGWMRFGVKTSTGDRFGEIEQEWSTPVPALPQLRAAAQSLVGEILQVPPMVSALKHEGERLYKLARKGITVERRPRRVFVEAFEILRADGRRIGFRVACARGTYVRTLVEDLGTALGAGACVDELERTHVGAFRAQDALSLEEDMEADDLIARSISMAEAVAHLPSWKVPRFWASKVRRGHAPPWAVLEVEETPVDGQTVALVSAAGELVALAKTVPSSGPTGRAWQDALSLQLVRVI
jgi:tRNA pseudouridine55 synthase